VWCNSICCQNHRAITVWWRR